MKKTEVTDLTGVSGHFSWTLLPRVSKLSVVVQSNITGRRYVLRVEPRSGKPKADFIALTGFGDMAWEIDNERSHVVVGKGAE